MPDTPDPAELVARVLWERMSDPLERRTFSFCDAPSRMSYLAHGRAVVAAEKSRQTIRQQAEQIAQLTDERNRRALRAADGGLIAAKAMGDELADARARLDKVRRAVDEPLANGGGMRGLVQAVREALDGGAS